MVESDANEDPVIRQYKQRLLVLKRSHPSWRMMGSGGIPLSPGEREILKLQEKIERRALRLARSPRAPLASREATPVRSIEAITDSRRVDPDKAKREAVIRNNPGTPNEGLCDLLDQEQCRLPAGWLAQSWTRAYKTPVYRPKVQVILAKAKRSKSPKQP